MRDAFCSGMAEIAKDPETLFLTGDLGFGALESSTRCYGQPIYQCWYSGAEYDFHGRWTSL